MSRKMTPAKIREQCSKYKTSLHYLLRFVFCRCVRAMRNKSTPFRAWMLAGSKRQTATGVSLSNRKSHHNVIIIIIINSRSRSSSSSGGGSKNKSVPNTAVFEMCMYKTFSRKSTTNHSYRCQPAGGCPNPRGRRASVLPAGFDVGVRLDEGPASPPVPPAGPPQRAGLDAAPLPAVDNDDQGGCGSCSFGVSFGRVVSNLFVFSHVLGEAEVWD